MLESIYERASEASEQGPVGKWLEHGSKSGQLSDHAALDGALAGALRRADDLNANDLNANDLKAGDARAQQDRMAEAGLHSENRGRDGDAPDPRIRDLINTVPQPDDAVWSKMGQSILDGVAAERAERLRAAGSVRSRSAVAGWRFVFVGAAASAFVVWMQFRQPAATTKPTPEIVFADLDGPPKVDFVFTRYGAGLAQLDSSSGKKKRRGR
ncbi:MAG: hypothetical protein AB8H80_03700 [Planctomycetota bacterium]